MIKGYDPFIKEASMLALEIEQVRDELLRCKRANKKCVDLLLEVSNILREGRNSLHTELAINRALARIENIYDVENSG